MLRTALIASLLVLPGIALGDVIPPDVASCQNKKEGDSCSVANGKDGRCQTGERCRPNYACDSGGGGPCGSICGPALVCKECKDCKDEGGCSVAIARPAESCPGLMLGIGVLIVALGLRRR